MKWILSIFLAVVLNPILRPLLSQELLRPKANVQSFNENFGLKEKTIYDILETEMGIYFGSNSGLYYFDGDEVKNYKIQGYPQDFTNLKKDPEGRIWFSNFNGQIFRLEHDSIRLFLDKSDETNIAVDYNLVYYPKVIFSDGRNLAYIDLEDKTAGTQKIINRNSILLTQNRQAVFIANAHEDEVEILKVKPSMELEAIANVQLLGRKKLQFIAFDHFLLLINLKDQIAEMIQVDLNNDHKYRPCMKFESNIMTYNRFSKIDDTTLAYLSKEGYQLINTEWWNLLDSSLQMKDLSMSKIHRSKSGITIITTLNHGVKLQLNEGFRHISFNDLSIRSQLFVNNDLYLLDQKGQLWQFNLSNHELKKLNFKTAYISQFYFDPLTQLLRYGEGNVAYNRKLDRKQKDFLFKFKHLTNAFGSYYGTYSHELRKVNSGPSSVVRGKRCNLMVFDSIYKRLYVDFIDGLHFSSDSNDNFKSIRHQGKRIFPSCLEQAKDGGVWISEAGGKVFKHQKDSLQLIFDFQEAFDHIAQNDQFLFLASDRELIRFDLLSQERKVISESDGLLAEEILDIHLVGDKLLVLNDQQLQLLDLNVSPHPTALPRLHIKSFWVNDQKVPASMLSSLDYQQNKVGLEFNSYHLSSLGEEEVAYRFSKDSSWTKRPGKQGFLEFPQLTDGDYQLHLKCCSTDGICSPITTINFSIEQAWFRTIWFYIGCFLLIVLSVILIARGIINNNLFVERLKRDKEIAEKERQLSKIKAIQAQMNPHFVFNALNSIQDYILSNQKDLASEYLADFADLVRSYLKQTQKDEIEIEEEINTLYEYLKLEKLRLGEKFDYQISFLDKEEEIRAIHIPVMLIQPFVENAIKHGLLPQKGDRKLLIQFSLNEDKLEIMIADNGIGIKSSLSQAKKAKGLSFGNKAVQDKIDLLNKHHELNLKVRVLEGFNQEKPEGTRVILSIDLKD